jgi:hypothetical protein
MINTIDFEPRSRGEETRLIDTITVVIWIAIGLVLFVTPLVMASLE